MKSLLLSFAVLASAAAANAQMQTSSTTCYAQTPCYDDYGQYLGQASCQVHGYAYAFGYSASGNSCQWRTVPYVGVQCAGYQQVTNAYGQSMWQWQNYSVRCPGR